MRLAPLSEEECIVVGEWRNAARETLRTTTLSTPDSQQRFYRDVVLNPSSPHRYWALRRHDFVGMAGLTDISWENGSAEISLIINPAYSKLGNGRIAFGLILSEAFERMRLSTVYGECYFCNPAVEFWQKVVKEHGGFKTVLPRRKFWDGELFGSLYFSIGGTEWISQSATRK